MEENGSKERGVNERKTKQREREREKGTPKVIASPETSSLTCLEHGDANSKAVLKELKKIFL